MYKYKVFEIEVNKNNAIEKNKILDQAITENLDFCFIKQNDIIVKDESIFNKYCNLMEKFKLGLTFYPYYKTTNRLFTKIPNVAINIRIKEGEYLHIVRHICRACLGFNLKLNTLKFNENLKIFEVDEYCYRLNQSKLLLANGIYLDVYESWNYFMNELKIEVNSNILITDMNKNIEMDKKYFNDNKIEIFIENNVDNIVKKLIEEFKL